jgi:glutamate/tyrosine decarboxylase-like PLP-dependent enzyme/glutathione synthase/RimK-type ligase-like ATP-grasp enzyme
MWNPNCTKYARRIPRANIRTNGCGPYRGEMQKTGDCNTSHSVSPDTAQTAVTSLDPRDWSAFRAQAHRMLDDILGSIEHIREQPVWQPIPEDVRACFREELPAKPTALDLLHQEFMTRILPFTARNAHPGFMAWVQGGGTPVGMLAEMLAGGLNANLGGRDQIPLEVERQITDWMRALFGFPTGASGIMVTGSSMANFMAVTIARDASLGFDVRRQGLQQQHRKLTAYSSTGVHGCVARALDFAGLGSESLRLIPVDSRHRIDLEALTRAVDSDREAGFTPFLVVGTAGTVDTGAIDDLTGIAAFCAGQQLWFHVDGACGALGMLAPCVAPRLKGIESADSLAFDFHKWGQVPYDAGFLLVRDGVRHQQTFASSSAYLARDERGMSAGSPWPCDLGPDLSRGFRALKTWATLKAFGTEALGAVIGRTCELAQYLESRIAAIPELEMLAPVELNIVCFRFGCGTSADPSVEEALNQLNRQIVIKLQESGAVAPSTTLIAGRLAIRAAIVNHRTTRADIDTLVDAVLAAGRILSPAKPGAVPDEKTWQPWLQRNARLQKLDAQLGAREHPEKDVEAALRFERAMLLNYQGRTLEARSEHLKVVELDPSHQRNLNALGLLLAATQNRKAALLVLAEAVRRAPESVISRVNYGCFLLEEKEYTTAREQFEAALRVDPKFSNAHAGLFYALTRLGEFEAAEAHRRLGFTQKSVYKNPYRGTEKPVPVLLLVSSTGGNTPIEKLLDDSIFETYVVVTDFFDPKDPLPEHRLVVNGIGDVDVSQEALQAAESLLAHTKAPVLNHPAAVLETGRCENASRLRNLPGVVAPATQIFPYSLLASPSGAAALLEHGFTFPLLLRVPGFHMGEHFVDVQSPEALTAAVAELPGTGRPEAQLLAIQYLDARGADCSFRKYRVMMIDGQLYPLHLAISPHWKIHYFSADMADKPDHRAEEAAFLADMKSFLGAKAMDALEQLQTALGLDYAGVDFGLSRDGSILLFEANATMVVQHPDPGEHWDYRRPAVDRIHAAVRQMLIRNAGVTALAASESNSTPLQPALRP